MRTIQRQLHKVIDPETDYSLFDKYKQAKCQQCGKEQLEVNDYGDALENAVSQRHIFIKGFECGATTNPKFDHELWCLCDKCYEEALEKYVTKMVRKREGQS